MVQHVFGPCRRFQHGRDGGSSKLAFSAKQSNKSKLLVRAVHRPGSSKCRIRFCWPLVRQLLRSQSRWRSQYVYAPLHNPTVASTNILVAKEIIKSFFAICGDEGDFTYNRGWESIPQNWYRRPVDYGLVDLNLDIVSWVLKYPELGRCAIRMKTREPVY